MSVPDTMRMDLADPRIYNEITLDRQQAQALVNEIDSLCDQAKIDSAEIKSLQCVVHSLEAEVSDEESRANEMARKLHEVREQRGQLLAQLEQLCIAIKAYRTGHKGGNLREALSNAHGMIAKMKTP